MNQGDPELLARLRAGEQAALAEVYDGYAPALYRYLYRHVGEPELAEDLTGLVFLKLVEALRRGQVWQTTFAGWLYRIAHNVTMDHFRQHGGRTLVELDEALASSGRGPDAVTEQRLRLLQVQQALRELTEEQAQVILLRFGEGLSNQEVAATLGKSVNAVKGLQHRALLALRHLLVEEEV